MSTKLFQPITVGEFNLKNRFVMSPMTRNRAIGNVPNDLMAEYYSQRAGAGLIVTEGTSPSPNGLGYPRIPGIFSTEQVAGWKKTTNAVHNAGGRIFIQLMHTGRIGNLANLPTGAKILAPSAVAAAGEMYTDSQGMQPFGVPEEMTLDEVKATINEYVQAAKNAIEAGFDGIELHSANGYLIEQFLHPHSNRRTDDYGGSIEKRARFLLDIARGCADVIGAKKVGVRLSPYGVFNDLPLYPEIDEAYEFFARKLGELGLLYIHIVDHSSMGAPAVAAELKKKMRESFKGLVILSGGYDATRASADVEAGKGDLVAFGRPFIANPNLVERIQKNVELATPDMATFYTPGPKGYTDYAAG